MSSGGRLSSGSRGGSRGRVGGRSICRPSIASPDVQDSPRSSEQESAHAQHFPEEDFSTVGDAYSRPGTIDPSDGKMWIYPDKDTFNPVVATVRRITKVFQSKYERPMWNWSTTPQEVRDLWFGEWKKPYKWHPTLESRIIENWNKRCSDRLRSTMTKIREKDVPRNRRPLWISAHIFEQLKEAWNDEKFKEKQQIAKQNRASVKCTVHGCGSIPASEHRRRMRQESGDKIGLFALFMRTHMKKGTTEFVDQRSTKAFEDYIRLKENRLAQLSIDGNGEELSPEDETALWLEAVGGKSKKGRVFGIGSEAHDIICTPGQGFQQVPEDQSWINSEFRQELIRRCENMSASMLEMTDRMNRLEEEVRQIRHGGSSSQSGNDI